MKDKLTELQDTRQAFENAARVAWRILCGKLVSHPEYDEVMNLIQEYGHAQKQAEHANCKISHDIGMPL